MTNNSNSFRSDQLLGTDVRTPQNDALGSIDDLVMNPQTGKIAYLVIARGGIFGIGEDAQNVRKNSQVSRALSGVDIHLRAKLI